MDSKTLKAVIAAGAIKQVHIIADGASVHIKFAMSSGDSSVATTLRGDIKTWSTIDAAAKWLRGIGIGQAKLNIAKWSPNQRGML